MSADIIPMNVSVDGAMPLNGRDMRVLCEYGAGRAVQRAADAARDASLTWGDLYGEDDPVTVELDELCMRLEAVRARMEAGR